MYTCLYLDALLPSLLTSESTKRTLTLRKAAYAKVEFSIPGKVSELQLISLAVIIIKLQILRKYYK